MRDLLNQSPRGNVCSEIIPELLPFGARPLELLFPVEAFFFLINLALTGDEVNTLGSDLFGFVEDLVASPEQDEGGDSDV